MRPSSLLGVRVRLKKINVGAHTLEYAEIGKSNNRPLLLLHGSNMGWGQWYKNILPLSSHFHVYAISLPGAPCASDLSFENFDPHLCFIEPIKKFLETRISTPSVIVGHSLGGWVALKMAELFPYKVKSLCLVNPLGFSSSLPLSHFLISYYYPALIFANTLFSPSINGIKRFLENAMHEKNALDVSFIKYIQAHVAKNKHLHPIILSHHLARLMRETPDYFFIRTIRRDMPMHILMGRHDTIVPMKDIVTANFRIKNSVLSLFENSGHVPFIEEAYKFNNYVIHNFSQ
jgi:pimeloyl-ACP methyl ester carboxylesterase